MENPDLIIQVKVLTESEGGRRTPFLMDIAVNFIITIQIGMLHTG